MVRPKEGQPTAGELEILKILWEQGPCTVREVLEHLDRHRRRAYTSVMSLMNVMADKGLVAREPQGRAFVYRPLVQRQATLGGMVSDLVGRVFEGSASELVARLLDETSPSSEELDQIRRTIEQYRRNQGNG